MKLNSTGQYSGHRCFCQFLMRADPRVIATLVGARDVWFCLFSIQSGEENIKTGKEYDAGGGGKSHRSMKRFSNFGLRDKILRKRD